MSVDRQQVADHSEIVPKWEITKTLSINAKMREGAIKFLKDNSILLMEDKALQL